VQNYKEYGMREIEKYIKDNDLGGTFNHMNYAETIWFDDMGNEWTQTDILEFMIDHERQALAQQAKDFEREKEIAILEGELRVALECTKVGRDGETTLRMMSVVGPLEQQLKKLKEQHD
jgi:uncharacterized damage-inducible protein DinB